MSSIDKKHCPACWDYVDELFYYEDFGFEICLACKGIAEKRKNDVGDENLNLKRAYKLSNGDVIQFYDLLLEFENNILYEVVEVKGNLENDGSLIVYKRTGRSFTPTELNELLENGRMKFNEKTKENNGRQDDSREVN